MYNCWVNHFKCPGKTDAQDAPRTNCTEWAVLPEVTDANPSAPQLNLTQFRLKEEAGAINKQNVITIIRPLICSIVMWLLATKQSDVTAWRVILCWWWTLPQSDNHRPDWGESSLSCLSGPPRGDPSHPGCPNPPLKHKLTYKQRNDKTSV